MIVTETLLLGIAAAGLLIGLISLILAIRANAKYKRLYRQYDYFMRGKDAETLEDYFVDLQQHVEALEKEDLKNKDVMRVLNKNIRASFQKLGIIRYNAFGGMSGFVINSVHSREGCFLYIKDVDAGTTEVELGAEEQLALEQALGYREKEKQQ